MTSSEKSITQQLLEKFSVPCGPICSKKGLSKDLQGSCDTGSQLYCASSKNITSKECQTYLGRVIGTNSGQKESPTFTPVAIPNTSKQTITDYYNALGDAADSYVKSNINTLSTDSVAGLMNIIGAEQGKKTMFNKVADNAIDTCASLDNIKCDNISWIKARVSETIATQAATFAQADVSTILQYVLANKNHYMKFMPYYGPIHNILLSKIKSSDLSNPTLIGMRFSSPEFLNSLDLLVLKKLTMSEMATIPLNADGSYNVDITNNPKLYDSDIRAFYKAILNKSSTDKLAALITSADAVNKNTDDFKSSKCSTELCAAMKATGDTNLMPPMAVAASTLKNMGTLLAKAFAPDPAKSCGTAPLPWTNESCISYVNGLTDSKQQSSAFEKILAAAAKSDGSYDKTVLDKYKGLQPWLVKTTADVVSTDSQGNTVITSACGGKDSLLTTDQCTQLCNIYPDICTNDQIQRCSLSNYRYETEKFNSRENYHDCNYNDEGASYEWMWIAFFVFIIVLAYVYMRRNPFTAYHTTQTNKLNET